MGKKFVHQSGSPNPPSGAAQKLMESWNASFENMRTQLLFQMAGKTLFPDTTYNPFKGDFEGSLSLSESGIQSLVELAKKSHSGPAGYWREVARFLKYTKKKLENMTPEEEGWLSEAVKSSGSEPSWQEIAAQFN